MTSEERGIVTDLGTCDFTPVSNYFKMKSEERKARSKEEKLVSQTCQAFRNNVSETEKQDRSPLFIHVCITAVIHVFVYYLRLSYTNCVLALFVCGAVLVWFAAKTIFFVYYYPTAAPTTHSFLIATLPFAGGEKEEWCNGGGVRLLQLGPPSWEDRQLQTRAPRTVPREREPS